LAKLCIYSKYMNLTIKFTGQSFLLQIWRFKNSKQNSQHPRGPQDPCLHFHSPKKISQGFSQFFSALHSWLEYLPIKKNTPKSNNQCPRYEGSKKGQRIAPICSLAPTPIRNCVRQGKTVRVFLEFFLDNNPIFNIYQ
jgi:hypothetical protein